MLVFAIFLKMPRNYVRKTQTAYSEAELEERVEIFNDLFDTPSQMSVREACELNDGRKIPVGTFWNRLNSLHQKRIGSGGITVLSKEEEEYLVFGLQTMADYGWGTGPETLKEIVANYVNLIGRENPFTNGIPGDDWLLGFRKRWKDRLSLRKPEYLAANRAKSASEDVHVKFMDMVDNLLTRLDIKNKPEHLYNCDEIGLNTDPKLRSVFARRGSKDVSVVVPTECKEQITVLVCGNAAGEFLPPFVVDCQGRIFLVETKFCKIL